MFRLGRTFFLKKISGNLKPVYWATLRVSWDFYYRGGLTLFALAGRFLLDLPKSLTFLEIPMILRVDRIESMVLLDETPCAN